MCPTDLAAAYLEGRVVHREYRRGLISLAGKVPELSAQSINSYLRARSASVSKSTVANERRMLLTLWRWGWEEGLLTEAPRGVMRVKAPLEPVRAWTISDVSGLVKSAEQFFGKRLRNGADLGIFLQTWIVLAYETGARYGDIFSWKRDNFRNGSVGWVTSKTGVVCVRALSDRAQGLVEKMLEQSPDGRVVGWVCCRRQSFKFLRRLISSSVGAGSGRWLRRSAATHVEMSNPGKAQWFLAHKTPGLAVRHYLDQSQLASTSCRPPPLW